MAMTVAAARSSRKRAQPARADASTLLTTIGQQLRDYTETTRKGTDALVAAANDHFGTAAQRLRESVQTLDEFLQELTEVLGKVGLHGAASALLK